MPYPLQHWQQEQNKLSKTLYSLYLKYITGTVHNSMFLVFYLASGNYGLNKHID